MAEEIRFRLWERKRHMIRDLVVIVGKALCIEVVDQVSKIEIEVSYHCFELVMI